MSSSHLSTAAAYAALSDSDGIVDVVGDVLGEMADNDIFCIRKHVRKRLDESELDERGGDTDGGNEKAQEGGRVGRV